MKGLVGGIPLALLVAAAQAQGFEGHHGRVPPQNGGTALGGPSGNDGDGNIPAPYPADVHTNSHVNEWSKENHAVDLKNTDVYPPPAPQPFGPPIPGHVHGGGSFPKRSWPSGGTAEGGPSGNDEGQSFNMPITGNFHTDVNELSDDDHSIHVKNKDIHPPPFPPHPPHGGPPGAFHGPPHGPPGGPPSGPPHGPPGGPPSGPHGPPHGPHGSPNGPPAGPPGGHAGGPSGPPSHALRTPTDAFEKRFGPEEGGTALGGPSGNDGGHESAGFPGHGHNGGTALGGPSGNDGDHGPAGFPGHGHNGGTALGGPSGNDGGQGFSRPVDVNTNSAVNEAYKDDHSIDLKHKDVYPPPPPPHFPPHGGPPHGGPPGGPPAGGARPFRRAFAPEPQNGGTALGGPSGYDGDGDFVDPTTVDTNSDVNEHHEDNHAVKGDFTNVHPAPVPELPWMEYSHPPAGPAEVPESAPHGPPSPPEGPPSHGAPSGPLSGPPAGAPASPPSDAFEGPPKSHTPPREEHENAPECAAKAQVVHTVTKTHTQYRQATATPMAFAQPSYSHGVQASSMPMGATPMQSSAMADPKMLYSSAIPMQSSAFDPKMMYSTPAVHSAAVPMASSSHIPYESYNYSPLNSHAASYSQIPVHVPMATPASSSMGSAMPSNGMAKMMPSGASPEFSSRASVSASASASASHGPMFTGDAARLSGGIFSAAAAVMGVLAFIL
ncbi:hypothetical protein NUU61_005261 [Penicillium alfredii]|uniref:GPI anchored protein n=1 Tax=Penicillium alfredii TaxID=1506179 RepID=A0A9W9F9A6_9EURO|nr:uncharacterized protein NUU61_005261 [Penicillium alfredii]KAJ5095905.1 hypothetical protein NUU61_005261 [Penicillium alfredii]